MKKLIRAIIFLIVLGFFLGGLQYIFKVEDKKEFQRTDNFYNAKKGSVDAVIIGASIGYASWQAPFGWHEYGYTVLPLAVASMSSRYVKYVIQDARQYQPDALYIVYINNIKSDNVYLQTLHRLADYMPFSSAKVDMVSNISPYLDINGAEQAEFYFPIIRFHSAWDTIGTESYIKKNERMMSAVHYSGFLNKTSDISSKYHTSDSLAEMEDFQVEILDDLLDYCKSENVNVLFIYLPQAIKNMSILGRFNAVQEYIQNEGFPCINLMEKYEEIGLDLTQDFYNSIHMNIHGSLKFDRYLCQYLKDNYGFEDKRGRKEFSEWDYAYDNYLNTYAKYYALDFELEDSLRDLNMDVPGEQVVVYTDDGFLYQWGDVEGADEYWVYRKQKTGKNEYTEWELVQVIPDSWYGDLFYMLDEDANLSKKYFYTAVPVKVQDDDYVFGKYKYNGTTVEF